MDILSLLLILALAGTVAFGLTQIVKNLLVKKLVDADQAPYWNALIRFISILFGFLVGAMFGGWPLNAVVGACGGVLSAVIFKRVRDLVKSYQPSSD